MCAREPRRALTRYAARRIDHVPRRFSRPPFRLASPGWTDGLNTFSVLGFVVGAMMWMIGWDVGRRRGVAHELLITPGREGVLLAAARAMPPFIDAGDQAAIRKAAADAGHPLLKQLLETLADWQPNAFRDEKRYQASFHTLLNERLGESKPERGSDR